MASLGGLTGLLAQPTVAPYNQQELIEQRIRSGLLGNQAGLEELAAFRRQQAQQEAARTLLGGAVGGMPAGGLGGMQPPAPAGMPPAPMAPPGMPPAVPQPQGLTAPPQGAPQRAAQVPGLMPLPPPQVVQQALLLDPQRTALWFNGVVTQRDAQLKEMDRVNGLVHQQTGLMHDQASYERGLQRLREAGVPVPKDLPPTYNPALVGWYHKSSADRVSLLEQAKIEQANANAFKDRMAGQLDIAKAANERRNLAGVRKVTDDPKLNAAIAVTHPQGVPPGGEGAAIQRAQQYLQDLDITKAIREEEVLLPGRLAVSKAHAENAARLERTEKPLEGDAGKTVANLTTLRTMTDDLSKLYKPEYAGWANRLGVGAAREAIGAMDDQETAFRATAADIQDILARLRTGAAMPPAEMRNLERLAPGAKTAPNLFIPQLLRFQRALEQARESVLRVGTTGREQLREETRPTTPRVGEGGGATSPATARPKLDPDAFRAWQQRQGISGPPTTATIEQYFQSQGGTRKR